MISKTPACNYLEWEAFLLSSAGFQLLGLDVWTDSKWEDEPLSSSLWGLELRDASQAHSWYGLILLDGIQTGCNPWPGEIQAYPLPHIISFPGGQKFVNGSCHQIKGCSTWGKLILFWSVSKCLSAAVFFGQRPNLKNLKWIRFCLKVFVVTTISVSPPFCFWRACFTYKLAHSTIACPWGL